MRIATGVLLAPLLAVLFAEPSLGASPDGEGPWADVVVSSVQGSQADGAAVASVRSAPASALGVAEAQFRPHESSDTFFSLGFGGELVVGFQNAVCNRTSDGLAVELVESTTGDYPAEYADVYFSQDGVAFELAAAHVRKTAQVSLPASMTFAVFMRIVDSTSPANMAPSADGYDIDGVRALNSDADPCPRTEVAVVPAAPIDVPGVSGPNLAPPGPAVAVLGATVTRCVSRRKFKIRVRVPREFKVNTARIFVNRKRVQTLRGKRLTSTVNLTGLPKGRITVRIVLSNRAGKKVIGIRKYRTCVKASGGRTVPEV